MTPSKELRAEEIFKELFDGMVEQFFETPAQTYRRRLKLSIMDKYGGKCVCCNEDRFEYLTIDHIDGNGKQHREEIGMDFYTWLWRNGCPQEGLRILCWNCHMSRAYYGYCPHSSLRPRPVLEKPKVVEVTLP